MTQKHSKTHMEKYKKVIQKTYGYEEYMDFLIIPSLTLKSTLSYSPLMNYTDCYSDEIQRLKELAGDKNYLIRALNPAQTSFEEGEPVTMRVAIESNETEALMLLSNRKCRNRIRKSQKEFNYTLKDGKERIEDFYKIMGQTYHRHGTPLMPKELFYNLQDEFEDKMMFFVVYDENNAPAAAICACVDGTLACCPWGGISESHTKKLAGNFLYFEVLKTVTQRFDVDVFDFGRSPYGGATYQFKKHFGAKPVKIELIKPSVDDIYSKYELASTIWKKLPRFIVDRVGPKLAKYLVDL